MLLSGLLNLRLLLCCLIRLLMLRLLVLRLLMLRLLMKRLRAVPGGLGAQVAHLPPLLAGRLGCK